MVLRGHVAAGPDGALAPAVLVAHLHLAELLRRALPHPAAARVPAGPEREQLLSGGAVCTNILIAAHAQGYAGQWITEWPAYRPEVVEALGHDPETDVILGFLYLGTPTEAPDERPRPALEEVVSEWTGPGARAAAE